MGYVGNTPALKYASFAVQHFTTSATTGYTLDNAVTNENGIALFINNVRQEPGASYAYTVSGTTLTLSAATTTSDTMYCVFIGKAVQTVNPPAGSVGTSQLAALGVTNAKIANSTVDLTAKVTGTLPIANGGTGATTLAGAGLSNTPNFGAKATSNQTGLSSGAWTKIQFDTAIFNVGSGYDTTNDKFVVPAGEGGKYFFTATAKINAAASYNLQGSGIRFTLNGAASTGLEEIHFLNNQTGYSSYAEGKNCNGFLNLSAADEVEVYAYYQHIAGTAGTITGVTSEIDTFFFGFKLVE